MKIFEGLSRTDYQDLFRAIGLMLDDRQLSDVRLWEHGDGLIIQGCPPGLATFETITLDDADLHDLLRSSYDRRGIR